MVPEPISKEKYKMVDAYVKKILGGYRIMCKRAKHKWWFELGQHKETDKAFARALANGTVNWYPEISDPQKILQFSEKK